MGYRDTRSDWPNTPREVMADEIDNLQFEVDSLQKAQKTLSAVLELCQTAGFAGDSTLLEFLQNSLNLPGYAVAQNLRKYREARGWHPNVAADHLIKLCGLSVGGADWSSWEGGSEFPGASFADHLAELFSADPKEFLVKRT